MQVISFLNMKGGVGKTTLAVNIAYGLAAFHRKNVLLIDNDPQFNATQYLVDDDEYLAHISNQAKATIKDIFIPRRGNVRTVPGTSRAVNRARIGLDACSINCYNDVHRRGGRLDLIPSTLQLIDIDTAPRQTEMKLKNWLNEKAQHYDYVIIDCPPTISIFTQAAILASDSYLVPIKPDPLSVLGLPLLERWLEEFTEDNGLNIKSVGMVFTAVRGPQPTRMKALMAEMRRDRRNEVFANYLSQSTYVAESVEEHKPVFLYKKNSKVSRQVTAIIHEFARRTAGG